MISIQLRLGEQESLCRDIILILAKKIKKMGIISISESGFIECEVKDSPITIVLTND